MSHTFQILEFAKPSVCFQPFPAPFRKWLYNLSGFRKYGKESYIVYHFPCALLSVRLRPMPFIEQQLMTNSLQSITSSHAGLMLNDVYDDQFDPEVAEAVRRLPADVYDARVARIHIAFQLSATKSLLPKEQWTKYEEDVKYLEPYLEEVKREWAEKKAYEHNNYETK